MYVDQILPQLFLGSCPSDPADIDSLATTFGITAVLNLQTEEDFASWAINWYEMDRAYRRHGIKLRRVPVQDFNPEELRQKLSACVQALDGLLRAGPHRLRALQCGDESLTDYGSGLPSLGSEDGA